LADECDFPSTRPIAIEIKGRCEDAAGVAVLPAPIAPWNGAPLRLLVVTEKPLEGELSLIGPNGDVSAKSREDPPVEVLLTESTHQSDRLLVQWRAHKSTPYRLGCALLEIDRHAVPARVLSLGLVNYWGCDTHCGPHQGC